LEKSLYRLITKSPHKVEDYLRSSISTEHARELMKHYAVLDQASTLPCTRNLIMHNKAFSLAMVVWKPFSESCASQDELAQSTSSCWVKVLSGKIAETRYQPSQQDKHSLSSRSMHGLSDALLPTMSQYIHALHASSLNDTKARMYSKGSRVTPSAGAMGPANKSACTVEYKTGCVSYIDPQNDTMHKLVNPSIGVACTLHLYSPPLRSDQVMSDCGKVCHVFPDAGMSQSLPA